MPHTTDGMVYPECPNLRLGCDVTELYVAPRVTFSIGGDVFGRVCNGANAR